MKRFIALCTLQGSEPGQFETDGRLDDLGRPIMRPVNKFWHAGDVYETDDLAMIKRLTEYGAIREAEEGE